MRKILALLAAAFVSAAAFAQYLPPPGGYGQTSIPFFAAGKTGWLAATTTSSSVAMSVVSNINAPQVEVYNSGTTLAYVACGGPTIAVSVGSAGTSTSDYPVGAGAIVVFTPQQGSSYCAGIYASGSGAIYFTPGSGL